MADDIQLFNRKAVLTFGKRGEKGVKAENLRIKFTIGKTSSTSSNKASITVFNLTPDSRGILDSKDDIQIILEIGYGNNLDTLFIGDMVRSETKKSGPDLITVIEIGDGQKALDESKLDKSYEAGIDLKIVMEDVIDTLKQTANIEVGTLDKIKQDIAQNGYSVSGPAKIVLEQLLEKQGLEYSIQDNELQILSSTEAIDTEAILLTPETGLIGIPIKKEEGIEFKALLQTTKMRPGKSIQIQSNTHNGIFRIRDIKFVGDTHGQQWFAMGIAI